MPCPGMPRLIVATLGCFLLAACETRHFLADPNLDLSRSRPDILVFPVNMTLSEVTTGGTEEVNALWTQQAETHATEALRKHLAGFGGKFVEIELERFDEASLAQVSHLVMMHSAVSAAIGLHKYEMSETLPTHEGRFDWRLGTSGRAIVERTGARYGLFVSVTDSYAGPGRVMVMVTASLLLGVYLPGGKQSGQASLVDLADGRVVWFNRLFRESGDLRTPAGAEETVNALLTGFPVRKP